MAFAEAPGEQRASRGPGDNVTATRLQSPNTEACKILRRDLAWSFDSLHRVRQIQSSARSHTPRPDRALGIQSHRKLLTTSNVRNLDSRQCCDLFEGRLPFILRSQSQLEVTIQAAGESLPPGIGEAHKEGVPTATDGFYGPPTFGKRNLLGVQILALGFLQGCDSFLHHFLLGWRIILGHRRLPGALSETQLSKRILSPSEKVSLLCQNSSMVIASDEGHSA
mmetsp:Transcript_29016/g.63890  ORF Transcript_29016/g.63890 Transcript_29016/m.63890 type:complete len:223 (-) Transcript_29016:262-930(-)